MPELPEVETIRRLLEPNIVGRTLARAEVWHPHVTGGLSARQFAQRLRGRTVTGITRRGKYLVFALERAGDPGLCLVAHLRMTGRLLFLPPSARYGLPAAHTHACFHLTTDAGVAAGRLFYHDVRKFGRLVLCAPVDLHAHLPAGRDPVQDGLSAGQLRALLGGRTASLKALLLRQDLVCGLGNIYVDEALHRAGLHPAAPAKALDVAAWSALTTAITTTLAEALAFQGTTLFDYRRPDGEPGRFGAFLRVYGRAGQPCRTCGATISRTHLAGRSSAFCPHCQPTLDPL